MAGVTTYSLLVVLVVGTAVGGLSGMVLGGAIEHGALLAIIAGLIAMVVAVTARNTLLYLKLNPAPQGSQASKITFAYAGLVCLLGSIAGYELAMLLGEPFPVWIGALAGLLSSILMTLLLIISGTR